MGAAGDARVGVSEGGGLWIGFWGPRQKLSGPRVWRAWPMPTRPDDAETSLPLHAAGARSLGLVWAGRIGGSTKVHVRQEVALDSSRNGVASKGPFPPWEYPAWQQEGRRLQSGQAGRAWCAVSSRLLRQGPGRSQEGPAKLMDV